MDRIIRSALLLIVFAGLYGCYGIRQSQGGGEAKIEERKINPSDIALPEGYSIGAVATDLTFPTGIAFDEQGEAYVVESGYSYGEEWAEPRLLKLEASGNTSVVAAGSKNGPWNGLDYHNGDFYVSEGGQMEGGKILKISTAGRLLC